MFAKLTRRRPSAAVVISLISLFVALGGTGYAAISISGKNVKNRSLTGKDVKKNSLGGTEIEESKLGTNSLGGKQLKESSLGEVPTAGRAGSAGLADRAASAATADRAASAGSAGSAINATRLGGVGAGAFPRSIHLVSRFSDFDSNSPKLAVAECPAGEQILGGGSLITGAPAAPENVVVRRSTILEGDGATGDRFVVEGVETDSDAGNWWAQAQAVCAKVG